ncbi:MAG: FecR domain-containing protein [Spirochaetes bacterium]|nr:FecR domain-containing protein [Spirochaetota bacterium]
MKSTLNTAIRLMLVISVFFLYECKGGAPAEKSGIVTFKQGTVKVETSEGKLSPVQVKDVLTEGDTVTTGEKSAVIVQFMENYVLQVDENSTVKLSALSAGDREFFVHNGKVLSKVLRTGANNATVKTPTAVASVRGTRFSVSSMNGRTLVAVSEGKVAVRSGRFVPAGKAVPVSKEEILADAGKAVEVAELEAKAEGRQSPLGMKMRPMSAEEERVLENIELVPVIPNAGKLTPREIDSAIKKAREKGQGENDKIKKLMVKKTRTIEEILDAFHRIDEVTLYDGRVIQGAIVSRGEYYTLITTDGTITIPETQIKESRVVK